MSERERERERERGRERERSDYTNSTLIIMPSIKIIHHCTITTCIALQTVPVDAYNIIKTWYIVCTCLPTTSFRMRYCSMVKD